MASPSSKKKKKKITKNTSAFRSSSFVRTLFVGISMGVFLFIFVTFIITTLPDKLKGQRDIRTSLEQILFEIPTQPFILLGEISGFSFAPESLFFLSAFAYALIGIFANLIWQYFRRRS